jgi:hypothetical protein
VEIFEIAEMAGAIFAFGGRSEFRHVLREDVARRNASREARQCCGSSAQASLFSSA